MSGGTISLGDPVPWFSGRTVAGARVDLHVDAGRWVVLAFMPPLDEPRAARELSQLLEQAPLFDESRLVVHVVLAKAPPEAAPLAAISGPALDFIDDGDGAIARQFDAAGRPRTVVLDPMLRAIAILGWDDPQGHAEPLRGLLKSLPEIDASAGVPLIPPILIVPRVFEFPLCDFLVELFDSTGGTESGFLLSRGGRTETVLDPRFKRRRDLVIGDPELRAVMRDRLRRRLVPAIERHLQFRPTRADRYMVCCYDAADGGHFYRHRDNLLPGSRHRRFAVSINLNQGFEGGDVVFPEFGSRAYRAPAGGAVVFSTGTLHQVQRVTAGRRYAFVPFLYGEADVATRLADNALLAEGGFQYAAGDDDRLDPA